MGMLDSMKESDEEMNPLLFDAQTLDERRNAVPNPLGPIGDKRELVSRLNIELFQVLLKERKHGIRSLN